MNIVAVLRNLSVSAALVLCALMLYAGEPNSLSWWAAALPFAAWIIGPTVAPFLIARRKPRPWFSVTMLLYVIVSSAISGLAYYDAFFQSKASTAALVMVFIPLYQWLALILLLLLCFGVAAWLSQRRKYSS